jgi:GNAT superfamily N-acetyltransferase
VHALREQHRVGIESLETATALLRRGRGAHPTKGLYEAADLQWWWRVPRATDDLEQRFWFDDLGRPEAAVVATDWGDRTTLAPLVMPDAAPAWVAHVVDRGLAHARGSGLDGVELEADPDDAALCDALIRHGFEIKGPGLVECWLAVDARPAVAPIQRDYRLSDRLDTVDRPHHMIHAGRNHPDVEARLRQTSLYRPDLDLVVDDTDGRVAAYGLFWYDPETATGLVEPMRTEADHQRRGLASHVLTTGIDRLADAGAARVKICYEPDNPASRDLYLGVGFRPDRQTVVFAGRTS